MFDKDEIIDESIEEITIALAKADDSELIKNFLNSILTENEIKEVATRWALVKQIDEGKSQRAIAKDLGLSLCKITRGSRELKKDNSPFKRMIILSSQK